MKYYSIEHSLNKKIMGHDPQVKEVLYTCNVDSNPLFIGKFHHEKITVEPIVPSPVLYARSKLTDLIYIWHIGFSFFKLISGKLRTILENSRNSGLQFIQCSIFKDNIEYSDYWLLNMFEADQHFIDIKKSRAKYYKKADDYKTTYMTNDEYLHFDTMEGFYTKHKEAKSNTETFHIDKLALKPDVDEDFFMLRNVEGGVRYMVSENLKKEIEDAGCTGIEFMPTELTFNEWLHIEREKIYGKA